MEKASELYEQILKMGNKRVRKDPNGRIRQTKREKVELSEMENANSCREKADPVPTSIAPDGRPMPAVEMYDGIEKVYPLCHPSNVPCEIYVYFQC